MPPVDPLARMEPTPTRGRVIEAVFAEYEQGALGRIHAVDIDGQELPGWPVTSGQPVVVTAAVTLFDVDGDGHLEALHATAWIWGYNASGLTLLDSQGAPLPGWPIDIDEIVESGFAIADLDLNGAMEIITAGHVSAAPGEASVFAFNHDGTPFPSSTSVSEKPGKVTPLEVGGAAWPRRPAAPTRPPSSRDAHSPALSISPSPLKRGRRMAHQSRMGRIFVCPSSLGG